MGSLYKQDVIDVAYEQVGKECGKTNEFSWELDQVEYFNYPKNGVADSCSIFIHDMTYRATRNANLEPEPSKWDAYYFLFLPDNNKANEGAGCTQMANYFKRAGAWYEEPDAETGDWIFFTSNGGETYYHVGYVVDWGTYEINGKMVDAYKTIQGNTDGGYVAIKYVPFGDSRIGGFGRPRYDGDVCPTAPDDDVEPTPEPTPEPQPEPTPTYEEKTVSVNTFLAVRTGASTDCDKIGELYNGATVYVFETDGNWARIGANMWVSMTYLV